MNKARRAIAVDLGQPALITVCRALGGGCTAPPRPFSSLFSHLFWEKPAQLSAVRVRGISVTALPLGSARWLRTEASWAVSDGSSENPFGAYELICF